MVFTSTIFLFLFLPFVLISYHLVFRKQQNFLLLFASLFFYAWGETFYLGIMLVSIASNYVLGLSIQKFRETPQGKWLVGLGVLVNLGILSWFKYANFIVDSLNPMIEGMGIDRIALDSVHLPIGISFFTFQALTYIVDVYRGVVPAQKNPIHIALYIALFPQLIAGPIVRYHDIASQIENRQVNFKMFSEGVRRFILGMGKKMLIANPLGEVADLIMAVPGNELTVFVPINELTASVAWLGIICYSLQIYFDFSGYSDMAIGLGRMFGFKFLENFNYPYISQSVHEFWRRWHISLSSWFKDYLYIPLGGNRVSPVKIYFNLCIVFLLCGLWHGASWNFVLWGMFHGLFLVLERIYLGNMLKRTWAPLRHIYFILVIMIGWVFFRLETFPEVWLYLKALVRFTSGNHVKYNIWLYMDWERNLFFIIGIICSIPILDQIKVFFKKLIKYENKFVARAMERITIVMEAVALSFIFILSILYVAAGTFNPFLYFRF